MTEFKDRLAFYAQFPVGGKRFYSKERTSPTLFLSHTEKTETWWSQKPKNMDDKRRVLYVIPSNFSSRVWVHDTVPFWRRFPLFSSPTFIWADSLSFSRWVHTGALITTESTLHWMSCVPLLFLLFSYKYPLFPICTSNPFHLPVCFTIWFCLSLHLIRLCVLEKPLLFFSVPPILSVVDKSRSTVI